MGDAIQCATLRATAIMECRQKADVDEMKASGEFVLGSAIGSGADPMKGQIDEMKKGKEVDMSNPNLDKSGFLGGGQCLAPISFSVVGHTVTQSFDALCSRIEPLRFVVMAICSILGYLIVARSVLGA
jgi:hypothetical protein